MAKAKRESICQLCSTGPVVLNKLSDGRKVCNQCYEDLKMFADLRERGLKLSPKTKPQAARKLLKDMSNFNEFVRDVWNAVRGWNFSYDRLAGDDGHEKLDRMAAELVKRDLNLLRRLSKLQQERNRIANEEHEKYVAADPKSKVWKSRLRPPLKEYPDYQTVVRLLVESFPGFQTELLRDGNYDKHENLMPPPSAKTDSVAYADSPYLDNCQQWKKQPHIFGFDQPWPEGINELVEERVETRKGRGELALEIEDNILEFFDGKFRRVELAPTSDPAEIAVIGHWRDEAGLHHKCQLGWLPKKTSKKINELLPQGTKLAARIRAIYLVNQYKDPPKLFVDIGRS